MSQENVLLAQRVNAMVLAGDLDGASGFLADNVVVTDLNSPAGEPNVVHGREAALGQWAAYAEVLDDFRREVDEWIDVGDWVIAVGRWKGRGKASGLEVEGQGATASHWRDGKIVEWILDFPTREAALEAVGLRE